MPPKRKSRPESSTTPAKKAKVKKTATKPKVKKTATKPVKRTKQKISKAKTKTETKKTKVKTTNTSSSDLKLSAYLQDGGWAVALKPEFEQEYFKQLEVHLKKDYKAGVQVFPPKHLIFNAFNKTPIDKVKVVILGQDPYHDDGQAMGMSFSVPVGKALPPSLKNMYKELVNDKKIKNFTDMPDTGCLEKWAERGVLLINATLTVEAHKPNSHAKYGWQKFTDNVIKIISDQCSGVVFVLWGNFAHKKEKLVDSTKHRIIKTAHPSPLSFNKWLGCKCFSNVNDELKKLKKSEIDWTV